jgi:Uma2 family endonuclease
MTTGLTILDDKIYTVEDYMQLNDDKWYELIGGKLIVVPKPRPKHQRVSGRLYYQLENFLKQNPIGEVLYEVDVHLGDKVVGPDVLFVSRERMDIIGELYLNAAPDLVIEVLSPATAVHDKETKSQLYYDNGVKEYWLVDPDQQLVDVFKAGENAWILVGVFDSQELLATSLLPGLEISLGEVFGSNWTRS